MASTPPLSLNDPVFVTTSSSTSTPLEGIVAYIGFVQKQEQRQQWVGIRLTGSSIGLGQHDGTVEGVQHFTCPPNCGLLVPMSSGSITKRSLSRLEELRLRRELANTTTVTPAAGTGTAAPPGTVSTPPTSAGLPSSTNTSNIGGASATALPGTTTTAVATASIISTTTGASSSSTTAGGLEGGTDEDMALTSASTATTSATTRTKLEELRLRRAALKDRGRTGTGSTMDSSICDTLTAATSSSSSLVPPLPTMSASPSISRSTAPPLSSPLSSSSVLPIETGQQEVSSLSFASMRVLHHDEERGDKDQKKQETTTTTTVGTTFEQQQQLENTQNQLQQATIRIAELEDSLRRVKALNTASGGSSTTKAAGAVVDEMDKLKEYISQLEMIRTDLEDQIQSLNVQQNQLQKDLHYKQQLHQRDLQELTHVRTELIALKHEVQAISDQNQTRGSSDMAHYKERAKLEAEMSTIKRQVEQLEQMKIELESALEDVTLDKDQLMEEKDILLDKLEELRLDYESAQIETDELRMQLEDAQTLSLRVSETLRSSSSTTVEEGDPQHQQEHNVESEDKAQALSIQNGRLREALIRLREQSAMEKMELTRQVRIMEKEMTQKDHSLQELQALSQMKLNLEEQINDLKEMVEQGSAFERMVEDLSDRIFQLEEDNTTLRTLVREMEESADLSAEMEEVQSEELKALSRDLEARDTIIRNLEDAIKMQKRREDDFRRTVGNYKSTVDTLRHEKQALLEIQLGGEGERSSIMALSQQALARAAHLVTDAAEVRRREAQAAQDRLDSQLYRHMSTRLERLLPLDATEARVAAAEVVAMKGEIAACRVVAMASQTLGGIAQSFGKSIRPSLVDVEPNTVNNAAAPTSVKLHLSDETKEQIRTMFHQADLACIIVEASAEILRFLCAGQWPDLLSPDSSVTLATILGHAVLDVDGALSLVLQTLKEEGGLSPDQCNINALRQAVQATSHALQTGNDRDEGVLVAHDWFPPGWQLVRDLSAVKYSCMGAAAAVSLAVHTDSGTLKSTPLATLYNKLEQCSSLASAVCTRIAKVSSRNNELIRTITDPTTELKIACSQLLDMTRELCNTTDAENTIITSCDSLTNKVLRTIMHVSSVLRAATVYPNDDECLGFLSPEVYDVWAQLVSCSKAVRSFDGDADDVNHLVRARVVEHRLGDAVDNEPKLAAAAVRVAALEKTLASRSKEVAMQNARLSELEKVLAKSSVATRGRGLSSDVKSSEEYNSLKEENRVLAEAMDVLQRQVDEYETEIRALKDFKSPKGGKTLGPRRATPSIADVPSSSSVDEPQSSLMSLEATVFRPALQKAVNDAARWKSAVTASIMELPPLLLPPPLGRNSASHDRLLDDLTHLDSAMFEWRMQKASMLLVDLTNLDKTPRAQLRDTVAAAVKVSQRLESMLLRSRSHLLT